MDKKIDYKELLSLAEAAREKSYCPYSGVAVGAALLTKSGKIYTGANIENAAYGPTVCAERVAIFAAVHDGEHEFSAVAIAGGRAGESGRDMFAPCGVCRQVMAEFADDDFVVIMGVGDSYRVFPFNEILPHRFTKEKL